MARCNVRKRKAVALISLFILFRVIKKPFLARRYEQGI